MRSSNGSRYSAASTTLVSWPRRRKAPSRNRTSLMPARASRTEPHRIDTCKEGIVLLQPIWWVGCPPLRQPYGGAGQSKIAIDDRLDTAARSGVTSQYGVNIEA